jgi:hypothetical protein
VDVYHLEIDTVFGSRFPISGECLDVIAFDCGVKVIDTVTSEEFHLNL